MVLYIKMHLQAGSFYLVQIMVSFLCENEIN